MEFSDFRIGTMGAAHSENYFFLPVICLALRQSFPSWQTVLAVFCRNLALHWPTHESWPLVR